MTIYEHELKNAYIGEVYEYSYDFRNKTIAQIQSDGWNLIDSSSYMSTDSNGLWCNTNGQRFAMYKSIGNVLSNATKITLTQNTYVNKSSTTGDSAALRISNSDRTNGTGPTIGAESSTGPQGYAINIAGGTYQRINQNMNQGLYPLKVEFDLIQKTAVLTVPGYTTRTQSMTDAQISTLKGLKYVSMTSFANANVPVYKTAGFSILVEY